MFLCARIYCSFLLSFYSSRPALSFFQQRGQKNQKISSSHFFGKKERKKEREKERRKKRRERENNGHEIFFSFFLFQSLSLAFSHSFARTNSRRRTSRNTSPTHPKLCRSTYDAHESARAKYHRSWWSRAVPTCHPNDAKPETLWQHWGFNFQIFWFRVRKKGGTGNAIKRAQRFKNCLGGSSLHTNGKRNGRRNE